MSFAGKLFSRSVIIVGLRLFSAGLMFATQAYIARRLGSDKLGQFTEVTAIINILSVVTPLGFQVVATYFAVEYVTRAQGGVLRRFLTQSYLQIVAMFAVLLVADMIGLPLAVFGGSIAAHWFSICLMAFALALVYVSGSVLVAARRPILAIIGDILIRPLIVAGAVAIALVAMQPEGVLAGMFRIMSAAFFAVALVYVAAAIVCARRVPGEESASAEERRRWWRFAAPWVVIAVVSDNFFDLDILLLADLLSYSELAVFGVMARVFALAAFGVGAVYTIALPDVFEAEVRSDRSGFEANIFRANMVATALACAMLAGIAATAPVLLAIFGPEFVAGAGPLTLLCGALVVRSVFGPSALVLSLRDRPYAPLPSVALGVISLALGNLLLAPPFGLYGAALSAVIAISIWSVAMWLTALRLTGVDTSILPGLVSALRRSRLVF